MSLPGIGAPTNLGLRVIRLRLQGSDGEHVALDVKNLPSNVYDVTSMLRLETAPRSTWRDVAAAYMRCGNASAAVAVLEQASSDDVDSMLGDGTGDSCSRTDLLAALAGAYVMHADSPDISPTERHDLLRKAADVFSRADLIDTDQPAIWTAKGAAEIAASRTHDAKTWFENAHQNGWVPAALGLASVLLNGSTNFAPDPLRASALLANALMTAPCPSGAWTGLGYALFRSGNLKMARNVLRRAVKASQVSSPRERLEALYALARVESVVPSQVSLENAIDALREAYVFCGGHSDSRVLALLAEIYFLAGDAASSEKFASRAVARADEMPDAAVSPLFANIKRTILSMAWFELARARHHQGLLDQALEGYDQVMRLAREAENASQDTSFIVNPGLYLRLGLLKLASGRQEDLVTAEECFKTILTKYDERCAVAMRSLGILIGRRVLDNLHPGRMRMGEQFNRAKDLLKRGIAAEGGHEDIAAMLVYAALVEETDPSIALNMHERSVEVLEKRGDDIPLEIYSNTCALLARTGRISDARTLADERLPRTFTESSTSLMYNVARLAEMASSYEEAERGYEAVLARDSEFYPARIRMACVAAWRDNNSAKAEEILRNILSTKSQYRIVAAAFLNKIFSDVKNPKAQQQLLESFRGDSEYMSLAFAQFMYSHLDGVGTSDRRHRFLVSHIAAPLQQILKRNKRNVYAANGVGVFFAENNMMPEARDAFSAAGCGQEIARSARVNLAHSTIALAKAAVRARNDSATPGLRYTTAQISSARGLCEQAEKLYCDAHDMSREADDQGKSALCDRIELLLYRANAKYEVGSYCSSVALLQSILHYCPDSATSWFNLGQVLRECAGERVLQDNKNVDQMIEAKSELEACRSSFSKASQLDRGSIDRVTRTRIDRKFLDHHTRFIQQAIRTHEVQLVNARNEAEDREKLRLEKIALIEAQRIQKEEEKRKELIKQEARQRELEILAAAAAEKLRKTEELARQEEEEMEMERSRKREFNDEDIVFEDGTADGIGSDGHDAAQTKRKRGRKREKTSVEKPSKRRKPKRESQVTQDVSSDEYGDDEIPDSENREIGDLNGNSNASMSESEGEEDDGVTRTRARKRFALAPESDDDH